MIEILQIISIGVMVILFGRFELAQHRKTRKDQQEIKTRLAWIMKRQLNLLKIMKGGK